MFIYDYVPDSDEDNDQRNSVPDEDDLDWGELP